MTAIHIVPVLLADIRTVHAQQYPIFLKIGREVPSILHNFNVVYAPFIDTTAQVFSDLDINTYTVERLMDHLNDTIISGDATDDPSLALSVLQRLADICQHRCITLIPVTVVEELPGLTTATSL